MLLDLTSTQTHTMPHHKHPSKTAPWSFTYSHSCTLETNSETNRKLQDKQTISVIKGHKTQAEYKTHNLYQWRLKFNTRSLDSLLWSGRMLTQNDSLVFHETYKNGALFNPNEIFIAIRPVWKYWDEFACDQEFNLNVTEVWDESLIETFIWCLRDQEYESDITVTWIDR